MSGPFKKKTSRNKPRKLGKWQDGWNGLVTKAYQLKRKKKLKTARKSRKLNFKKAKR